MPGLSSNLENEAIREAGGWRVHKLAESCGNRVGVLKNERFVFEEHGDGFCN